MPSTLARYEDALRDVSAWWHANEDFPKSLVLLDRSMGRYIESLWAEGGMLGSAADALSSMSFTLPFTRGHLRESWRLFKTWRRLCPPRRCAPMSPLMCCGLAGAAFECGAIDMAALILIGFDGILRTQSLLLLRVGHVKFLKGKAVAKLVRTKTTMRRGGLELCVIKSSVAVNALRLACEGRPASSLVLARRPDLFRDLFKRLVQALGMEKANLALYSLRRGGASHDFLSHGSMEQTLVRGHWSSTQAARVYVQDAAAEITTLRLSTKVISALSAAAGFLKPVGAAYSQ